MNDKYPIISNKLCPNCKRQTVYLYQKRRGMMEWIIVGVRCSKCNWSEFDKVKNNV